VTAPALDALGGGLRTTLAAGRWALDGRVGRRGRAPVITPYVSLNDFWPGLTSVR